MTEEERALAEKVAPWREAQFAQHLAKAERKWRRAKMFNELCWQLNRVGLAFAAAGLRRIVAAVTPTSLGMYESPQGVGGWRGWLESPVGVVAFINDDDGALVWRW